MPEKHKGFTLMELMIVMAIIAIASAAIIPRIGNSDAKRYQAQLKTLSSTLNYNRRNAIVMNRPFEMTVFPHTERSDTMQDESLSNAHVQKKDKGDWHSQGADIEWHKDQKNLRNKIFSVKFFPQGGASGGMIKLQQGRFIAQLSIDGITGKVSIKESVDESND